MNKNEYFIDKEMIVIHKSGDFRWRISETDDGILTIFDEERESGNFVIRNTFSINSDAVASLADALKEAAEYSLSSKDNPT